MIESLTELGILIIFSTGALAVLMYAFTKVIIGKIEDSKKE